jgi:hypothetical protein
MGGDRVCPDDCLLAAWHSLPDDQKTPARRRPIVEQLAKQGYTQEAIATQLGVSQKTVSNDLQTLVTTTNVDRGKDTRGRKKSTGRPKGSKKRQAPKPHPRELEAVALADQGLSGPKISAETGIPPRQVRHIVDEENIRREAKADPNIDPATLSMTAQQKLEAAIRQHKRKLDLEFEYRVRAELKKHLDEVALPHYTKQIAELERSIRDRKGIMDRITYRKILACLHPDRVTDLVLKKRYEDAFRLFTELEKRVLNERESPTTFQRKPRTYEELMAMKRKNQEANRAKRAARQTPTTR